MATHSPSLFGVYDDLATRSMGAAYRFACVALAAEGEGAAACALRDEIAAALLEAADDGLRDALPLALAAIDLVRVDVIEMDFS